MHDGYVIYYSHVFSIFTKLLRTSVSVAGLTGILMTLLLLAMVRKIDLPMLVHYINRPFYSCVLSDLAFEWK